MGPGTVWEGKENFSRPHCHLQLLLVLGKADEYGTPTCMEQVGMILALRWIWLIEKGIGSGCALGLIKGDGQRPLPKSEEKWAIGGSLRGGVERVAEGLLVSIG